MLPILYRDEHLIAIHKPSGLLVHRSEIDRHETRFAVQLLRDQIGQWVWPVHRLDRGTSGVLLFALTKEALSIASRAFEHNEVEKTYLAVVRGWPTENGLIDYPLSRQYDEREQRLNYRLQRTDDQENKEGNARSTTAHQPEAQSARTRFERLKTVELPFFVNRYPTSRYALLRVFPETGRRHQIRRHLKHIAHPIIGDSTHGKGEHNRMFAANFACSRMLLLCQSMQLPHPMTGQNIQLCASESDDFYTCLVKTGLNP